MPSICKSSQLHKYLSAWVHSGSFALLVISNGRWKKQYTYTDNQIMRPPQSDSQNQLWNTHNQMIKSPQSASHHSQTVFVCSLCDELWNTNHTVYSMVIIKTRIHIIISFLALSSPWYNCNGRLGIKHQVTYLLGFESLSLHLSPVFFTWPIQEKRKCLIPKDNYYIQRKHSHRAYYKMEGQISLEMSWLCHLLLRWQQQRHTDHNTSSKRRCIKICLLEFFSLVITNSLQAISHQLA